MVMAIVFALLSGVACTILSTHIQSAVNPHVSSQSADWKSAGRALMRDFRHSWVVWFLCFGVIVASVLYIAQTLSDDATVQEMLQRQTAALEHIEQTLAGMRSDIQEIQSDIRELRNGN